MDQIRSGKQLTEAIEADLAELLLKNGKHYLTHKFGQLGSIVCMANLRDIRRRIKSVKNTRQITRAMQLVSSSKMKRSQDAALAGRPYAYVLEAEMLNTVSVPLLKIQAVKLNTVFLKRDRSKSVVF